MPLHSPDARDQFGITAFDVDEARRARIIIYP